MAQVYQHAIYYMDQSLEAVPTPRTIEQRMMELEQLTIADLIAFHKKNFLSTSGLQIMVHGNVAPEQAIELGKAIPQILRGSSEPIAEAPPLKAAAPTLQQRIVQFPRDTSLVFRGKSWNEENTNHCALQYYPFGIVDLPTNACLSLLRHLIAEPAYNQLRTQEQLGYVVHSQLKTSGDHVKALVLLVQGEAKDPVHMDERMRLFWQSVRTQLVEMPDDEFLSHRKALYENFMESKKNLLQESASHWNHITNQTYHFDRIPDIAKHLQTRTKQDVLQLIDRCILYGSSLSIQMFGQGTEIPEIIEGNAENGNRTLALSDPIEFGRTQSLHPLPPTKEVQMVNLHS